jgi:hypothetical protein
MIEKLDEYEALGIFPDTWTCVAIMERKDMERYVVALARSDTPAKVSRAPDDPARFHIAVQGGLKANPAALLVTFRDGPINEKACRGGDGQHPMDPA